MTWQTSLLTPSIISMRGVQPAVHHVADVQRTYAVLCARCRRDGLL